MTEWIYMKYILVSKTFIDIVHGGCFKTNSAWNRVAVNDNQMTVGECKRLCFEQQERDYNFAGVQNRVQCWCGNDISQHQLPVPQSQCSMSCPGDFTQKCGGSTTMNVYQSKGFYSYYLTTLLHSIFRLS